MLTTSNRNPLTDKVLNDFLAFCAVCFYIRDKQGDVHTLIPNEPQKELIAEFAAECLREVILKARQLGISTICIANFMWRMLKNAHRNALILAQDKITSAALFDSFKFAYDRLPEWLCDDLGIGKLYESKSDLSMSHNGSSITISSAESYEPGRGKTIHYVHLSESAYYPDPKRLTRALFAAVPKTGNTAVILESTGNGPTGFFHDRYQAARKGRSEYRAHFLPWFKHREYRLEGATLADLDEDEEALLALGATMENLAWRRSVIANDYNGETDDFRVEYPSTEEEAFLSQTATIFNPVAVQKRAEEVRDLPYHDGLLIEQEGIWTWIETPYHPKYRIWKAPRPDRAYVIGADVGSGVGGPNSQKHSFSSADVLDVVTGEQVAHYHGMVEPSIYAQDLAALGYYYNTALIAPEVTGGWGLEVCNALRDVGYPHLYRRRTFDNVKKEWTEMLGWNTSPRTKELIITELRTDFRLGQVIVNSLGTLGEMLSFVRDPERRTLGGSSDSPDDQVISLALAAHVRRENGQFAQAAMDAQRPKRVPTRQEWEAQIAARADDFFRYGQVTASGEGPQAVVLDFDPETGERSLRPQRQRPVDEQPG